MMIIRVTPIQRLHVSVWRRAWKGRSTQWSKWSYLHGDT